MQMRRAVIKHALEHRARAFAERFTPAAMIFPRTVAPP